MSNTFYTADDLAQELGCSSRKIREQANVIGAGIKIGGRSGYRFSDADRIKIHDSMRIEAPAKPRRKRRAA